MKRLFVVFIAVAAFASLLVTPGFGADKLLVKDATGTNTVFVVTDTGKVGVGNPTPTAAVDVTGPNVSGRGLYYLNGTDHGFVTVNAPAAGVVGAGFAKNGTIKWTMGIGSSSNDYYFSQGNNINANQRLVIKAGGFIGIGTTSPASLLHVNGTISYTGLSNVSSREYKDNIQEISSTEALKAVAQLNPVSFTYKMDPETTHLGFIAEDVPSQVATKDRKGVMVTEVIALLTKVVQEQTQTIANLSEQLHKLEGQIARIKSRDTFGSMDVNRISGN